jgi:hypothetical protein
MTSEYESLRAEIKEWQDRRFTILTASIGLTTAILGFKAFDQPQTTELWPLSVLLLLLLSCACALTWYAGRGNAMMAAYLIHFHERPSDSSDGWESRLSRLQLSGLDKLKLNQFLGFIYLLLAAVAVFVPVSQHPPSHNGWIVLSIAIAFFVSTLLLLMLASSQTKRYFLKKWEELPAPKQDDRNA